MRHCPRCGVEVGAQARFCPYDGIALDAGGELRTTLIGSLVNSRYRIGALLGEGGMAWVFFARHEHLGRDVALKVLRPELAQSEHAIARFAREARAASRIDHDNVVKTIDFGRAEEGFYYLAMEYISGVPLDREIERVGAFHPMHALHVIAQIVTGVSRAHELNIIHRDLKPENVMLTQRGGDRLFVKILDFGLSKAVQPEQSLPSLTREGDVFGTPQYMAPEQWRGAATDARTDIYAIGAIAYELLTGSTPYPGTALEQMRGHLGPMPEPLQERHPEGDIAPRISDVVLRCLAKDPNERYQTAADLLDALGQSWTQPPSRNRQTTYGQTRAAPPARDPSEVPDPTVYQSGDVDVIWDGPFLCEEIARLHRLRGKRLAELTQALWGARPPDEVQALVDRAATAERAIDQDGQEVAVLQVRLEELHNSARRIEADLRHELFVTSMRAQAARHRLPLELGDSFESEDTDRPSTVPPALDQTFDEDIGNPTDPPIAKPEAGELEHRLRRAERRLESFERSSQREQLDLEMKLTQCISRIAAHEGQLAPIYEKLSAIVRKAAARRTELRPQLVAFGQIDGALVAYQALLEMLEVG